MVNPPAGDVGRPPESRRARLKRHVRHFIKHGPFAIAASSLPGFVNYGVVLYLAFTQSVADAGTYRLLTAWFALLGLAALTESSKVAIRATAASDWPALGRLLTNRLFFSVVALAVVAACYAVQGRFGVSVVPADLVILALIAAVSAPTDLYRSVLQARQQFFLLLVADFGKYLVSFAAFVASLWAGGAIREAVIAYFAVMMLCHLAFTALWLRPAIREVALGPRALAAALRSPDGRDARTLSLANLLPNSLEHVDKMLIGRFFGLHALGLYTIGFSTGRFIYNALKPALYVYYMSFVDRLPSDRVILVVTVVFTLVGIALSALLLVLIATVPQLATLKGTEWISVVLFLAYGVAMGDAVYTQAYAINKETKSVHVMIANGLSSALCLVLFGVALMFPVGVALLLFAAHYGLRHLATVVILSRLKARQARLSA